jgi:glycosyltransferase involved in cell wall biosynthesis
VRIAHVGVKGIPANGGTERVVQALARRHAARHAVTVYGSRRVCSTGKVDGVRVVALPTSAHKYAGPLRLQTVCALHALVVGSYDVVHLHGAENAFVLPLLRLRYPVVTTNHGPAYARAKWGRTAKWLMRSVEGVSVRMATVATAVAEPHARRLAAQYAREVIHIPNGVDGRGPVDYEAARARLAAQGVEPESYWLFAAGRTDPTKGCHTFLEAHGAVEPSVPALVVGDLGHAGGYEAALRRSARGQEVRFVPHIDDRSQLNGIMKLAKVFVFPSSVEAMSMMLLDAIRLGVPTVASATPENLAVLPSCVPTFRVGDPEDLATQVIQLCADPHLERRVDAAWVLERSDWDAIASRYEAIYFRSIARR